MAKYKLTDSGVLDTETGAHIPNDSGNRHWQEYQVWLTQGSPLNTADPADVFVEDWDNTGRRLRDEKLTATDWTQLADAPLDVGSPTKRNEFAVYRQALRDLPSTYPDYSAVVWPTEPTYPE